LRVTRALAALALAGSCAFAAAEPAPRTVAEQTGFQATSSYEETLAFLRDLAARMPELRLQFFGTSAQGRALPLVVVARDRAFTPQAAARTGRAVVLIQNGIHGGEIDGKDASLMLLRDMAEGTNRELLDGLVLLVVPIYNVDGHERVSPYNRPNQHGPVRGMGFRTTADGHDLNRDHLKLDTPEARAMIRLFNDWRPHLHVDNHVTDGSDHDWVLTYTWVEAPQAPASLQRWLSANMPEVIAATAAMGHRLGPYVSLLDRTDPSKGFDSYVGEPRYATGYYPLRDRPSILVENHSYKPYADRVLADRDFMLALLRRIAAAPRDLIDAVAAAERATVEAGQPDAPASSAVLRYRRLPPSETIEFPVYAWSATTSQALGTPLVEYRSGEVRQEAVPWAHRVAPELVVPRPRGYLIEPGWPEIEARLAGHGLDVRRLEHAASLEVETLRLSNARRADDAGLSYQGRTRTEVDVERRTERRSLPAGTLWVPADQPDFEVAIQLLEPEAPDSLVAWGVLSGVTERKEYIDPRVLERLARDLLDKDEALRTEWSRALEDPAFVADSGARYLWWYRRTPYWDDSVGLLPIYRLMTPPALETSRWLGPLVDP